MVLVGSVKSLYVGMCRFEMRMSSFECTPMLELKLYVCCCWCSVLHSCACRPGLDCSAVLVLKLYVYRLSVFSTSAAAAYSIVADAGLVSTAQPC